MRGLPFTCDEQLPITCDENIPLPFCRSLATKSPLKLSESHVNYMPGGTSTRHSPTLQCQWSYLLRPIGVGGSGSVLASKHVSNHVGGGWANGSTFKGLFGGSGFTNVTLHVANLTMPMVLSFKALGWGWV